jgi:hypothetical protein
MAVLITIGRSSFAAILTFSQLAGYFTQCSSFDEGARWQVREEVIPFTNVDKYYPSCQDRAAI